MTLWLERTWHNVRHAVRLSAKSPGFTAIAVLSIACGTGANVAMFSAVDAMLLRPLPVRNPGELITVHSTVPQGPFTHVGLSHPDFVELRARSRSFQAVVAYHSLRAAVSLGPSDPKQVKLVTIVSGNFFDELGVELQHGRGFSREEDRVPGRDAVAVISHGVWQQLFSGDPGIIGRRVSVAGTPFTIVGVTAESFTGIETDTARESLYVPIAMWATVLNTPGVDPLDARDMRALTIKGRLVRTVALGEAQAELSAIAGDLERLYPHTNDDRRFIAQTEFQWRVTRTPLRAGLVLIVTILSAAVLCVACTNVAGLLASRAPLRARELAVRLAIGAGRGRLVAQLLTESLLIALAGGIGGLAIGYAGIVLFNQIQYPTDIVAAPVMRLDLRALAFSLALAMASAVTFGLGPALSTTRIDLSTSFRSSGPAGMRRWRLGGRSQLIAVQVALSLVVLTMAGITLQTFAAAFDEGPGFRTTHIAKLSADAGQAGYTGSRAVQFFERLVAEAQRLPSAKVAAVTSAMPLWDIEVAQIIPDSAGAEQTVVPFANVVDEGYFATMNIPVLGGREFLATDSATAPAVAILNETLAKRYWPTVDPVGQRFQLNDASGFWVEIVGVVRDSMYLYPAEPPQEMVYFPYRQQPRTAMTLLVQTTGPSVESLAAMRALVQTVDAEVPTYDVHTMERFYDALATRLAGVILSMVAGIGVMGVAITVIGLYGLVSFAVTRRTREIGIRIAVGATYQKVLTLLLRQGLVPAWVGLGLGLLLSSVTARLLPSIVPFSEAYDARSLFGLVPVLFAVTLLAAFVPARRAANVNPSDALRHE